MSRSILFALQQKSDGTYEAIGRDGDGFIRLEIPARSVEAVKGAMMATTFISMKDLFPLTNGLLGDAVNDMEASRFAAVCFAALKAGKVSSQLRGILRQVEIEFLRVGGGNHTPSAGRRRRTTRKEP